MKPLFRKITVLSLIFACALIVGAVDAGGAAAADLNFGFESAEASETTAAAGMHPDLTTSFALNSRIDSEGRPQANARVEDLSVELPPGLVGSPAKFPTCEAAQLIAFGACPIDSQVGVVETLPSGLGKAFEPLYNLQTTSRDQVAKLGFVAFFYPIFIDLSVRSSGDYGVTATVQDASGKAALISSKATIWGNPADHSHDPERLTPLEAIACGSLNSACLAPEGKRQSGLSPTAFLSNPSACEPQSIAISATSYQLPGQIFSAPPVSLPPTTGCDVLSFEPELRIETSSHAAGAPTGLSAKLRIPQTEAPTLPSTSMMRAAKVTLPKGMTISESAGDGLEACSVAQVGLGQEVDANCPQGSKLATATFVSPALPEAIHGAVYQRTPEPGHLFRLWLVTDERGLHLKLPGEITTGPDGQVTTEFANTPQLPVEEIDLEFKGGPKAPLKNPESCGRYTASYEFTPWSGNPPVSGEAQPIAINEGCNRGGFSPKLEAGVTNPVAGAFSPMVLNLKREDGEDNISSFDFTLPKGQLAKLKGVPLCSDADAATGGCSTASQIGSVAVASGVGTQPLWVPQPGKAPTAIFLAGPYKGAPYSIVTKVPAQAGPFDLGTVVVRTGLYIDPNTAQVTAKTDPLPQILQGVPISYRTIHVSIDRENFVINPTNCAEQSEIASVTSVHGAAATPSDRFQVGECAALDFGPTLKLQLKGGTKRGMYPALTATLQTHRNEANFRKVSVALPHSEFLAQNHINTICTRVQFAANQCPAGSVYGRAQVVTPLLDQPLEGPVFLRSSNNPLPDLVVALHGAIDVNLVGRIDSIHEGIRTTFSATPDAPITKFVLKMRGGKKSLLVNSTDICAGKHRAIVKMNGQNGKEHNPHPLVRGQCGSRAK